MNKKKFYGIMLTTFVFLFTSAAANASWWHKPKKQEQAVTNWLVVINYPEYCASADGCTADEVFGNAGVEGVDNNPTKATVCYLTGQVVQKDGRATFAGALGEGHSNGCFFPGLDDADPHGLKDAMRAEIHVILQTHGVAKEMGYGLEEQLTRSGAECNPDCVDVQFAVHLASAAVDGRGSSDVYWFSDETAVYGATSTIFRDREGVRVVTQTTLDPVY